MYAAQGVILKREDFRERDERVVLYTKEFWKLSVIAKGTKRIQAIFFVAISFPRESTLRSRRLEACLNSLRTIDFVRILDP